MLNGLMKSNGWFPTMFDDFFNTDFMPRANSTAPAVNVKESEKEGVYNGTCSSRHQKRILPRSNQ